MPFCCVVVVDHSMNILICWIDNRVCSVKVKVKMRFLTGFEWLSSHQRNKRLLNRKF